MRTGLLLLTFLLVPLTGVALDFQHRDTVLLTDIDGITAGRLGRTVGINQGSLVVGSDRWPDIDGQRFGAVFLYEDPGIVLCGGLSAIFCDGFEDTDPVEF